MKRVIGKEKFEDAFSMVPYSKARKVRAELKRRTGWGQMTFYNKMHGWTKITLTEVPIIEEVFKGYGLDAWTGNKIPKYDNM